MEKLWKMLEEYRNIIQHMQMQILNNLGFSKYTMPLYIMMVIGKRRLTESKT